MSYPSENQKEGLQFLIDSINNGNKVTVLSGQGGSGKTTLAKDLFGKVDKVLHFSASTNKAASRLSISLNSELDGKKIEVLTMHSRICVPTFTAGYIQLEAYFKEIKSLSDDKKSEVDFKENYPKAYAMVSTKIGFDLAKVSEFDNIGEMLGLLKIDTFGPECFVQYDIKSDEGKITENKDGEQIQAVNPRDCVLIIDEASMLPRKSIYADDLLKVVGLDNAMKVYGQIILLGDINQLPPIQGESSFDGYPTFELTENFRANDNLKGIIQWVLDGNDPTMYKPSGSESKAIRIQSYVPQGWYDKANKRMDVVNICYTNKTRKTLTKKIRGENGKPVEGDVVYYNGFNNSINIKGDIGVVNDNLHFKYDVDNDKISEKDKRIVIDTTRYFDEYAPENGWSFMRYGYAITCHMSQGSEWDHVIVHANDIPRFIKKKEKMKWLYTAISRAQKTLTIIG